jgi:hypothetical protein
LARADAAAIVSLEGISDEIALERGAAAERRRHDPIAEVAEADRDDGIYDVLDDYDLSSRPHPWRTSGL